MPKAKKKVTKKLASSKKLALSSKAKAPKWYVLSSFAVSIILIFIYFVDYFSTSALISNLIGICLIVWFSISIFMLIFFIAKKYNCLSIAVSGIYVLYMGLMFLDGFLYGFTNGNVQILSEATSNNIEFISIILILVLSSIMLHKKEYI